MTVRMLEKIRATLNRRDRNGIENKMFHWANRKLNKQDASNDWRAWLGLVAAFAVAGLGLFGLTWVLADATPSPDPVIAALEQLQTSAEAIVTSYAEASHVMVVVLEKAWELTWPDPGQPPSNPIQGSPVCWHISKFDTMVNESPVQVWRCESSGIITWDFRFEEAEPQ